MLKALVPVMVLLAVASCGRLSESRINPVNWFGGSAEEEVEAATVAAPEGPALVDAEGRRLVNEIVTLRVERTPAGAIVKATGLPSRQAYYDAELIPLADGRPIDGVLEYRFRISPPAAATPAGPPRSREIIVARFVSEQDLRGVQTIRVRGATNALVSRR